MTKKLYPDRFATGLGMIPEMVPLIYTDQECDCCGEVEPCIRTTVKWPHPSGGVTNCSGRFIGLRHLAKYFQAEVVLNESEVKLCVGL